MLNVGANAPLSKKKLESLSERSANQLVPPYFPFMFYVVICVLALAVAVVL